MKDFENHSINKVVFTVHSIGGIVSGVLVSTCDFFTISAHLLIISKLFGAYDFAHISV